MPVTIAIRPPIALMIGEYSVEIADSQLTKDVVANALAVESVNFIGRWLAIRVVRLHFAKVLCIFRVHRVTHRTNSNGQRKYFVGIKAF